MNGIVTFLVWVFVMVLLVLSLPGCATFEGMTFDNRIACSVAGDKAFVVSEYGGRIGISSTIANVDRAYICGE